MIKMKGLGRGLDALLAGDDDNSGISRSLEVSALQPGKYQPRTRMDQESLQLLAESVKSQGIMQPILVRQIDNGRHYEIVAGERRWRAAQLAGLEEVPVLIKDIPDESALVMSLIENIQREDLNPLEEAAGIQRLIDEFGMTHQQAADAVGRSRPAASNLLRLLQLADPVQELLSNNHIDMGHARALLPLVMKDQIAIGQHIADKGLSVREVEKLVQKTLNPPIVAEKKVDRDLERLQEELSDNIGAEVKIKAGKQGAGTLAIRYNSLDQLDGILNRLR